MFKIYLKTAVLLIAVMTILTGLIYPAIVTGIAQLLFPWQANGSLIEKNGKMIGSFLIGQSFINTKYFMSRPSETSPFPYNGESSSGSNSGPSNPTFLTTVKKRVMELQKNNPTYTSVPVDLVTASSSGLDPDISPLAAFYQAPRIAKLRNLSEEKVRELIKQHIEPRSLAVLGEPRVNVLLLNLALDDLTYVR